MLKKFNKYTISNDKNIIEALKKINNNNIQTLFVLKNKKFFGVIQDSDIRRALLKNFNRSMKVEVVCKKKAQVANTKTSQKKINTFLENNSNIKAIPVINKKKELKKIIFNENKIKNSDVPILFFSGGKGIRMLPLTKKTPKPLIKINDKSILENQLEILISQDFKNIFLTIQYLKSKFKKIKNKYKNYVKLIEEQSLLGTCGGLINFINKGNKSYKNIITINADILTNIKMKNLLDFHNKNNNDITICVKELKIDIPYGVINLKNHNIIDEKPSFFIKYNVGINLFNFSKLKKLNLDTKKFKGMDLLINHLRKKNFKVGLFPIEENLYHFTNINDVKLFKKKNVRTY
jgi:CTP:phosphocholine cytidylyltransferase-like protein